MTKTHRLVCQHDGCGHEMVVAAGNLPAICRSCHRRGWWLVDAVLEWSVSDVAFLRGANISPG